MKKIPEQIALELVPRSLEGLLAESRATTDGRFPITDINIPEIRSVDIKSHPATAFLLDHKLKAIPHFRTIDRDLDALCAMVADLVARGVNDVLLITGDPLPDAGFQPSGLTPVLAAPVLRQKFPQLRLFAGFDPYRQSMRAELEYCKEKLHAGFHGFFSQPFFDSRFASLWLEQLEGSEVWLGISPVTTKGSRNYWESINKAVFPKGFQTDLAYNCKLNRELLEVAAEYGQKAYLMPITISAEDYLAQLFA